MMKETTLMTDKSTKTKKPKLELVTDNEIHEKLLTGDGNRPAIDNERKDILNVEFWERLVWYARKPSILKEIAEKQYDDEGNYTASLNQKDFFEVLCGMPDLVPYKNADIDCVCREIKSIQLTQSDYLPDGEQRNADWQHGFNSGCLGILREISARQFSEENPDEELDYYFPDLDS